MLCFFVLLFVILVQVYIVRSRRYVETNIAFQIVNNYAHKRICVCPYNHNIPFINSNKLVYSLSLDEALINKGAFIYSGRDRGVF